MRRYFYRECYATVENCFVLYAGCIRIAWDVLVQDEEKYFRYKHDYYHRAGLYWPHPCAQPKK